MENTGLLHWRLVEQSVDSESVELLVCARGAGTQVALAAALSVAMPDDAGDAPVPASSEDTVLCDIEGQPTIERRLRVEQGGRLVLTKYAAVVPGTDASDPLALARAKALSGPAQGYAAWLEASEAVWREAWNTADVLVEGDIEAQIALRFNIFHLLIAAPRHTTAHPSAPKP